jgi:hypothetical protein
MALADKYQSVVDAANQGGVTQMNVQEQGGVLYITGVCAQRGCETGCLGRANRFGSGHEGK